MGREIPHKGKVKMVYYLLLVASIVLAVCKSSLYNSYAKKNELSWFSLFSFNALSYGVAAVISLIGVLVASQSLSPMTVLCAFFYAVIVISLQTASITAMSLGTMSTTSLFVMYGMIIPAAAGPIFWKEDIGPLQIVGMIMMLVSLWFINGRSPTKEGKKINKWMLLAIVAFLLSGMAGVMEKIHQSTRAREENLSFVCMACAFMLAFSLVAMLITRKGREGVSSSSPIVIALISGLAVGLYSTVNLVLAGNLDSMIYYPIANGGAVLLTVLVSAIPFKEKFDTLKIIGVGMGFAGILCLSIPI